MIDVAMEKEVPHNLRERIWTPVVTLFAFIKQKLINGGGKDAVTFVQAELSRAGKESCSDSTSAYCQARQKLPESLLWDLLRYTGEQLEAESQMHWRWRGRSVKLADGSTAVMSDTEANQKVYPQESNQKEGLGFPILRIEIIASLNSGGVLDCGVAPYSGKGTGESALFRAMSPHNTKADDIFLMDRYYEDFWTEYSMIKRHADMLCPIRSHRKIDWNDGIQLGKDRHDRLFTLKKPSCRPAWMTPEEYAAAPASITVRIFRIYGNNYVTTLLDQRKYRKNALRKLYAQRWNIEVDLRFIKCVMHMEFLQCKTPEMVRKEIAVTLLAYNLIRLLIMQAAIVHHVWPRHISFEKARSTYKERSVELLKETGEALLKIVRDSLKTIAEAIIFKRPGRSEPREIKRRHSRKYPCQKVARSVKNQKKPVLQNLYQSWFRLFCRDAKPMPA